jgi:hypothetical protein
LIRKEKQIQRLRGKQRPEHSRIMTGRKLSKDHIDKLKKPKSAEHNAKVSAALKGKHKSEEHKEKLRKPKPLVVCRLHDRKEMALGNYMNWYKRQINYQLQSTTGLK